MHISCMHMRDLALAVVAPLLHEPTLPHFHHVLLFFLSGLRRVPTCGVIRDYSDPCRPSYIKEWWSVVNWAKVSEYYEKYAAQGKPVVCDLMLPPAFWQLPPARSSPLDPRQLTRHSMAVMRPCAHVLLHTPT